MNKNKKTILSLISFAALLLNLLLPAVTQAYTVSLPGLASGGSVNIDVNKIELLITPKTKAIIPVSLFGLPADLNRVVNVTGAKEANRITARTYPPENRAESVSFV